LLPRERPLVARHAQSRALESGSPITWVDGRGGGTGYLWAIVLNGAGAETRYPLGEGAQVLAFDLGIERGSSADAVLRIEADRRPLGLFSLQPGHPPQRIVLSVGGVKRLRLALVSGGGRVVVGSPRVYPKR